MAPDLSREIAWISEGISLIAGVDEAGRGPLAGEVVAAAVILRPGAEIELAGVNDSKKLTPKRRTELEPLIKERCLVWACGSANVEEIDRLNILKATFLAMQRAVAALATQPQGILVDGNQEPGLGLPTKLIINGDGLSLSIAAASVLAKVERDRRMQALHLQYPQYGFDKHKGYGSAGHRKAILEFGPCPAHRPLFIRSTLAMKVGL